MDILLVGFFLMGCFIITVMITGTIIALQRRDPVLAVKTVFYMGLWLLFIMGIYFLINYEEFLIGFFSKFMVIKI